MMLRILTGLGLFMIGNCAATHPHFQCAQKAPFHANDWWQWANCEWSMEHPQKCREGEPQRMMTCQVVCSEAEPVDRTPSLKKVCANALIDLTFLVDGSASVGTKNFDMTRLFLEEVTKHLDLGANATHVNMVQFSDRHNVEIISATNKTHLSHIIKTMPYHAGMNTLTGEAITFANEQIFMTAASRHNATQVLIVVTDGQAKDDVQAPIEHVHMMGIETIAVGVGKDVDMAQLGMMASKPKNVHAEADFASLEKLQKELAREICTTVVDHKVHTTVAPSSTPTMSTDMSSSTVATAPVDPANV